MVEKIFRSSGRIQFDGPGAENRAHSGHLYHPCNLTIQIEHVIKIPRRMAGTQQGIVTLQLSESKN